MPILYRLLRNTTQTIIFLSLEIYLVKLFWHFLYILGNRKIQQFLISTFRHISRQELRRMDFELGQRHPVGFDSDVCGMQRHRRGQFHVRLRKISSQRIGLRINSCFDRRRSADRNRRLFLQKYHYLVATQFSCTKRVIFFGQAFHRSTDCQQPWRKY